MTSAPGPDEKINDLFVLARHRTSNPAPFVSLIEVLKSLGVQQTPIRFCKDSIRIEAVNSNGICLIRAAFRPFCGDEPIFSNDVLETRGRKRAADDSMDATVTQRRRTETTNRAAVVESFVRDDATAEEVNAPIETVLDSYDNFVAETRMVLVDTASLAAIIAQAKRGSVFQLTIVSNVAGGEVRSLHIMYKDGAGTTMESSIPHLHGSAESLIIPTMRRSCYVELPLATFHRAVSMMNNHSNDSRSVRLALQPDVTSGALSLTMSKSGVDGRSTVSVAHAVSDDGHETCVVQQLEDVPRHLNVDVYPVRVLVQITKLNSVGARISLHWGHCLDGAPPSEYQQTPLRLRIKFHDIGEAIFYVAPYLVS